MDDIERAAIAAEGYDPDAPAIGQSGGAERAEIVARPAENVGLARSSALAETDVQMAVG